MNNDLISRKALVKALIAERDKHPGKVDGEHRRYNQAVRAGIHKALRAAEEAPAVDPVPVVHGRWHGVKVPTKYGGVWVKRSACTAHSNNSTNFCPHCGAKMDLE